MSRAADGPDLRPSSDGGSLSAMPVNHRLVLCLLALAAAGYQPEPPPSHIFHTGRIVTVENPASDA